MLIYEVLNARALTLKIRFVSCLLWTVKNVRPLAQNLNFAFEERNVIWRPSYPRMQQNCKFSVDLLSSASITIQQSDRAEIRAWECSVYVLSCKWLIRFVAVMTEVLGSSFNEYVYTSWSLCVFKQNLSSCLSAEAGCWCKDIRGWAQRLLNTVSKRSAREDGSSPVAQGSA